MSKAGNLAVLYRHGFRVPRGFSLAADHYRRHATQLVDQIAVAGPNAAEIETMFLGTPLDRTARAALDDQVGKLGNVARFAVRSSARIFHQGRFLGEDGASISFAGQFESYLNVSRARVGEAVKRCWASLFNARSLSRFDGDAEYMERSEMTVVVQEMISAKASAVMMTCDPQSVGDIGAIESTWGPCEAIVAGMVNPDEYIFDRRTGRLLSAETGSKRHRVHYRPFMPAGDNVLRRLNPPRQARRLSLSQANLDALIALGAGIEGVFGYPQDIEAVVDADDEIVITQARNITTLSGQIQPFHLSSPTSSKEQRHDPSSDLHRLH